MIVGKWNQQLADIPATKLFRAFRDKVVKDSKIISTICNKSVQDTVSSDMDKVFEINNSYYAFVEHILDRFKENNPYQPFIPSVINQDHLNEISVTYRYDVENYIHQSLNYTSLTERLLYTLFSDIRGRLGNIVNSSVLAADMLSDEHPYYDDIEPLIEIILEATQKLISLLTVVANYEAKMFGEEIEL